MVSDLTDLLRHLFGSFGRPTDVPEVRATDQTVERMDRRLTTVEDDQREIEARLRRLEIQGWRDQ